MDSNPENQPVSTDSQSDNNVNANSVNSPNNPFVQPTSPSLSTQTPTIEALDPVPPMEPLIPQDLENENKVSSSTSPSPSMASVAFGVPQSQDLNRQPSIALQENSVSGSPVSVDKKSKKPLFIIGGIIAVLVIGLVAGYFIISSNADKSADKYIIAVKSYLEKVYDEASSTASSPEIIKKSVSKLEKPSLGNAFLGDISSKYSSAKKLIKSMDGKLSEFNSEMDGYITVYDYTKETQEKASTMSSTVTSVQDLKDYKTIFQDLKDLTDEASAPSELETNFSDASKALGDAIDDLDDLIAAYEDGDRTAYTNASNSFTADLKAYQEATDQIEAYYNDLSEKIADSADKIDEYKDTIK